MVVVAVAVVDVVDVVVMVVVDDVVAVVVVVVLSVAVVVVVVQGEPHMIGQAFMMDSNVQNESVKPLHEGGSRQPSSMVVVVVAVAVVTVTVVAVAVVVTEVVVVDDVRVLVVVMHDLHIPLQCMLTSCPIVGSEHVSNVNSPVSQSLGSGTPLHEYLACVPHVVVVVVAVVEVLGVVVDVVVDPIIPPATGVPL